MNHHQQSDPPAQPETESGPTEEREKMVSETVQAELARLNLSPRGFSERHKIDRHTFARFAKHGWGTLDLVERWARAARLDVNDWRELCGFPRVPETNPERALEVLEDADLGDPDDPEIVHMVELLRENQQRSSDGQPQNTPDKDLLIAATILVRRRRKRESA